MHHPAALKFALAGKPFAISSRGMTGLEAMLAGPFGKVRAGSPRAKPRASATAVIPLQGMIFQRENFLTSMGLGTALQGGFISAIQAAAADPAITRIVIDVDSAGGELGALTEAADAVSAAAKLKKVIAVANGEMLSAAYAICSGASEIVASPSAQLGGIGVSVLHSDQSEANRQEGVKTTVVKAGLKKAAASPYGPLDAVGRAELQSLCDDYFQQIVAVIATGRKTTQTAVRANFGQGGTVRAKQSLAAGMVDRIASLDEVLRESPGSRRPDAVALAQLQRRGVVLTDVELMARRLEHDTPLPSERPLVDADPVATALHEAGHVVLALVQGVGVVSANILPSAKTYGQVLLSRGDVDPFDSAVIDYAGFHAEDRLHPVLGHVPRRHGQDVKNAAGLKLSPTMMSLASAKSAELVAHHEREIRAVAESLLQRKSLTGAECAAIVQHAVEK